jgi:hypothetical protein
MRLSLAAQGAPLDLTRFDDEGNPLSQLGKGARGAVRGVSAHMQSVLEEGSRGASDRGAPLSRAAEAALAELRQENAALRQQVGRG